MKMAANDFLTTMTATSTAATTLPGMRRMSAFIPHISLRRLNYTSTISASTISTHPTERFLSTSPKQQCPLRVPYHRHHKRHLVNSGSSATMSMPPRASRTISKSASRTLDWRGDEPTRQVQVIIERPSINKRSILAANLIQAPLSTVWKLLTDYNNLSTHIPNLVMSKQTLHPRGNDGIRLEQCGAQKILGFQFRAGLTMDMEEIGDEGDGERCILFDLVKSSDFKQFYGVWKMKSTDGGKKTELYYSVAIVPKGLVPVAAIEWRISEDIPQNLDAVRLECERRRRAQIADSVRAQRQ